jgi:hypothetical protein
MTVAHFFQGWKQREVLMVIGLAIASLMLWRVPWLGWLFFPFHVFGIFVHELGHGLAAMATGGEFRRFVVFPNAGLAETAGGIRWIIVSAGYIGSALFGGLLIIISSWGAPAKDVLFWLGIALGIMCILFVRNFFGLAMGAVLTGGLILAGRYLPAYWASGLLLFLAVQSMLNALDSVFDLVKLSTYHQNVQTDAQAMAQMTFLPAIVWSLLYSGVAIAILVGSLNIAYRQTPGPPG